MVAQVTVVAVVVVVVVVVMVVNDTQMQHVHRLQRRRRCLSPPAAQRGCCCCCSSSNGQSRAFQSMKTPVLSLFPPTSSPSAHHGGGAFRGVDLFPFPSIREISKMSIYFCSTSAFNNAATTFSWQEQLRPPEQPRPSSERS